MKKILLLNTLIVITTYGQNLLGGSKSSSNDAVSISNNCNYRIFDGKASCNPAYVIVSNDACCPETLPYYCSNTKACYGTCEAANDTCIDSVIKGSSTSIKINDNPNNVSVSPPTKNSDSKAQYKCEIECLTLRNWALLLDNYTTGGSIWTFYKDFTFKFISATGNFSSGKWEIQSTENIFLTYQQTSYRETDKNAFLPNFIKLLNCNTLIINNEEWGRPYDKYGPFYGDNRCK